MRIFIGITTLWLMLSACGSNETKTGTLEKDTTAQKSYIPIDEYVKGEITTVDSLPVGILKKFKGPQKTDSVFIDRSEFHALANQFASPELSQSFLEQHYVENSFKDESTGYYSFTYQPKNEQASFGRIDVLVKPGPTSDKVRSLYLEKAYNKNDTAINERWYWKANTSFTITREKKYKDQNPVIEQLAVIWDPAEY